MTPRPTTTETAVPRDVTCGRQLRSIATGRFLVTDVQYAPGDIYASHAHEHAYLILICSGGFVETASRREVELTSGDVLVMPAGHPHRDVIAREGARGLLVTMFDDLPPQWRFHCGGRLSRAMIAMRRDIELDESAFAIEEHVVNLAADACALQAESIDTRAVRIAREMIEAHSARQLRLSEVARNAGVTASYLARTFRRSVGRTMGSYLRSVRARRAAAMLAASADSLVDVAAAVGFADQSHMSRVFKLQYGMSPRRYRLLMSNAARGHCRITSIARSRR